MQSIGTFGGMSDDQENNEQEGPMSEYLMEAGNEEKEENKTRDHWVTLVEDGSDLAKCKKCKVNLIKFKEKYNFENQEK
jgi:hypothetical protein